MHNCIYCKITEKREDAHFVYEDDTFCAFLHPMPINHGHVILTPIKHTTSLTMLEDDEYGEIHKIAKKIAVALLKTKEYDGFHIQYNHGECAGQDCGHGALHIIPRVGTDGFYLNWRKQKAASEQNCQELASFLNSKIKNDSRAQ